MDLNCSGSLKWIFLKIKSQKGTSSTEKKSLKKCYLFNRWSFCSIFWWLICPAEAWRLHSNLVEDLGIQWKSFCWCLFSTCLFFEVYLFFKKMRIMDYIHFLVCLVGYSYNPIFVICLNIPISKISDHRICGWRPRVSTTGFLLVRGGHPFIFSTMFRELFCNWRSTHNSQTIKLQLFFLRDVATSCCHVVASSVSGPWRLWHCGHCAGRNINYLRSTSWNYIICTL